ncbi:MAG: methionine--tRNA ligase [Saprospiraceae bacterium]|nr:methionine--tRNA ligase [Saprospiraceae bacterium]
MKEVKRYLVTAALPYANGPLHIGHIAGAYLPADIYVRYLRMMGKDVVFVCGSDEHGAAITMKAKKENSTPQEIVDKYHHIIKDSFNRLGFSFDIYHRTSSALHHETSQEFFKNLYDKNVFEERIVPQYYDEEANVFLADRYITGTCPKCHNPDAYGDQCEKCGSTLSPTDLISPRSTITGSTPILRDAKHWYLPLNNYESWLREWINTGTLNGEHLHYPEDWKNHVIGQCNSWLDGGLQPRAMTRDLDWGVDVPQGIEGAEGKKLYVWLDAPIGYISATKQWAKDNGKDWEPYWKSDETSLIHFIGKDNIVFHCLIFPAILNAHGNYILPKNVPANQFLNLEGKKLSTSKNWAVWANEYLDEMPGMEDVLRYVMAKNMPEQRDSEFTWKNFQELNNNELVNNLANFVNRVMVLTHKYYEGKVPQFDEDESFENGTDLPSYFDSELLDLHDSLQDVGGSIMKFEFRSALSQIMEISSRGNLLLQANEPWKRIKDEPEMVASLLNVCLQIVTAISVISAPFLPFTSDKLRKMLNLPALSENDALLKILDNLSEGIPIIEVGHLLNEPSHLFNRIPDEVIDQQIEKLKQQSLLLEQSTVSSDEENTFDPLKEEILYDDFSKMDIRTGKIVAAEKVPKADKLLKLEVDLGFEVRTIVSGIAEHFLPEEIIGKQVLVLANLAPRKLRGIESKGMILMAENKAGKLAFVSPTETWENGRVVK